jgi:hypothetical protein
MSKQPIKFIDTDNAAYNAELLKKIAAAPSIIDNYKKNYMRNKEADARSVKGSSSKSQAVKGSNSNNNTSQAVKGSNSNSKSTKVLNNNLETRSVKNANNNNNNLDTKSVKSAKDFDSRSVKSVNNNNNNLDTRSVKSVNNNNNNLDTRSVKSAKDFDSRSVKSANNNNLDSRSVKNINKYDLESRPDEGSYIPQVEKVYTPEQIEALTSNCFVVPRNKWDKVPAYSRIKYIDVNGKFNEGGSVKSVGPETIALSYGFSKKGIRLIQINTIKTLYKQYAYSAAIEIDMLINSVKELTDHIKQLKMRITELERK